MHHSPDRRDAYRLVLSPGQATVRLPNFPRAELVDLSASGGRLVLHDLAARRPTLPPWPELEVDLGAGEVFRSRFEVVELRPQGRGVFHLGARWNRTAPAAALQLSRFIARELERRGPGPSRLLARGRALPVNSPLFIRNLINPRTERRSGGNRIALVVGARAGAELRVSEVAFQDGRRVIRGRFVGSPPTLAPVDTHDFVITGAAAVTVFSAACLEQRGEEVTLTLPTEVRQVSSRGCRRTELERSGPAAATVSYRMPRSREERRSGVVLNVAGDGLGFLVAPEHVSGLFPGDELRDFTVHLPDGVLGGRALVRSLGCEPRADQADVVCGVELRLDPKSAERWRRFVFTCMHPNIVDGGAQAESAWQILCASKYVEQWTAPEARDHVHAEYLRAWSSPASEIAHSLLLARGDTLVGTSAGTLVYPRSWLLHHLARDGRQVEDGQTQAPLKEACELISGILQRLRTETSLEHFLIYLERGKRFNDRLYVDFAERYFDPGKLVLTKMEVYRRSSADPVTGAMPAVDVVAATPSLYDALAAHVAATTTPLERRALALDREQLDLEGFRATCAEKGHERSRTTLFALEGGRARAALIAETGSEGANLFGLLNTCRVVGLDGEPPSEAVRTVLLARAVEHYRAAGKQNFLFFDEVAASPDVPIRLGYQFISSGLGWIGHRDVITTWAAYLEGLLSSGAGG